MNRRVGFIDEDERKRRHEGSLKVCLDAKRMQASIDGLAVGGPLPRTPSRTLNSALTYRQRILRSVYHAKMVQLEAKALRCELIHRGCARPVSEGALSWHWIEIPGVIPRLNIQPRGHLYGKTSYSYCNLSRTIKQSRLSVTPIWHPRDRGRLQPVT